MRGHLADIINRAKFYLNQIRGFDSVWGRIFDFPIGKRSRRLTHGLNYRSACDNTVASLRGRGELAPPKFNLVGKC